MWSPKSGFQEDDGALPGLQAPGVIPSDSQEFQAQEQLA